MRFCLSLIIPRGRLRPGTNPAPRKRLPSAGGSALFSLSPPEPFHLPLTSPGPSCGGARPPFPVTLPPFGPGLGGSRSAAGSPGPCGPLGGRCPPPQPPYRRLWLLTARRAVTIPFVRGEQGIWRRGGAALLWPYRIIRGSPYPSTTIALKTGGPNRVSRLRPFFFFFFFIGKFYICWP